MAYNSNIIPSTIQDALDALAKETERRRGTLYVSDIHEYVYLGREWGEDNTDFYLYVGSIWERSFTRERDIAISLNALMVWRKDKQ